MGEHPPIHQRPKEDKKAGKRQMCSPPALEHSAPVLGSSTPSSQAQPQAASHHWLSGPLACRQPMRLLSVHNYMSQLL